MKKQNFFIRGRCEHSNLTELLYLDEIQEKDEKKRAQLHLQQCSSCQQLFHDLEIQYKFINKELQKPVSNKTLDLAKAISARNTKYGLVFCKPIDVGKAAKNTMSYKSKVIFTANGAGPSKSKILSDFDLSSLPQDTIAIRAMTDKTRNKLLLYLWSPQEEDFDGWEIRISGLSNKATFSQSGVSQIPLIDIEDLNDKVIYFKERHSAFASGNRSTTDERFVSTL